MARETAAPTSSRPNSQAGRARCPAVSRCSEGVCGMRVARLERGPHNLELADIPDQVESLRHTKTGLKTGVETVLERC